MKHLLIIMLSLVSIQLYGQDSDLDYLGTTAEGINFYTKPSYVKVEEELFGQYKIWISGIINDEDLQSTQAEIVTNFKNDKLKRIYTAKMLYYVDCQKDMLDICRTIFYDKDGNVLLDNNSCEYDIQYSDVIPDTLGESIFNYTCKVAQSKR